MTLLCGSLCILFGLLQRALRTVVPLSKRWAYDWFLVWNKEVRNVFWSSWGYENVCCSCRGLRESRRDGPRVVILAQLP